MSSRWAAAAAAAVTALAVLAAVVALSVGGRPGGATALLGSTGAPKLVAAASAPSAPELTGVSDFDNTPPLTLQGLRGRVVLVDFWTYSCINCRRTFPFLRALHQTYASQGLTVLGIHSPEFAFEKVHANVARAVRALDVTWPVAEDPAMATWNAFGNQYWPADYLIDRTGRIRFTTFGEGNDPRIEAAVRALLAEGGRPLAVPSIGAVPTTESPGGHGADLTPETYFGAERGGAYLASGQVVPPGRTVTRSDPGQPRDQVALTGRFTGAPEALLPLAGASVTQGFSARDVYLTAATAGTPVRVEVTLDGQPVPTGRRGPALTVAGGRTVVTLGPDDLYHLLTGPAIGTGRLGLRFLEPGARLFTFTYGA